MGIHGEGTWVYMVRVHGCAWWGYMCSWTTFDTLRKSALEQRPAKRQRASDEREAQDDLHSEQPTKKCRIGSQENNIDMARLLDARSWTPNVVVNWSELGRRYGLIKSNGGQIIKEILQKHTHTHHKTLN